MCESVFKIPSAAELLDLLGEPLYHVWEKWNAMMDEMYDMERLWNDGGKKWTYEYKYRRGGKTLCACYAKEHCMGLMVIFGREEREKFEAESARFSPMIRQIYEEAQTFHDGKWMMFEPVDTSLFPELALLLAMKRKPNRKGRTSAC